MTERDLDLDELAKRKPRFYTYRAVSEHGVLLTKPELDALVQMVRALISVKNAIEWWEPTNSEASEPQGKRRRSSGGVRRRS